MFLDPDSLKKRENLGDSRTFKADIVLLIICMDFKDLLSQNWGWGKIGEEMVRY